MWSVVRDKVHDLYGDTYLGSGTGYLNRKTHPSVCSLNYVFTLFTKRTNYRHFPSSFFISSFLYFKISSPLTQFTLSFLSEVQKTPFWTPLFLFSRSMSTYPPFISPVFFGLHVSGNPSESGLHDVGVTPPGVPVPFH